MSAARYKQAMRILERWPTDPSKGDKRDIGQILRKRIGESFKKGEQSEISDPEKCDKMLTSLENITLDKYKNQYACSQPLKVGALLNEFEVVHVAVSEEGLEQLKRKEFAPGRFSNIFGNFFRRKVEEESEAKKVEA